MAVYAVCECANCEPHFRKKIFPLLLTRSTTFGPFEGFFSSGGYGLSSRGMLFKLYRGGFLDSFINLPKSILLSYLYHNDDDPLEILLDWGVLLDMISPIRQRKNDQDSSYHTSPNSFPVVLGLVPSPMLYSSFPRRRLISMIFEEISSEFVFQSHDQLLSHFFGCCCWDAILRR